MDDQHPRGGVSSSSPVVTLMMVVLGHNSGVWGGLGGRIGLGCGREDEGLLEIDRRGRLTGRRQIE